MKLFLGNFECGRILSCCNYGCQLACAAIAIKEAQVDSCKDGGIVLLNALSNKVQGGARGLLVLYRPNVSCCKEASAVSCCLFLPSAGSKLSSKRSLLRPLPTISRKQFDRHVLHVFTMYSMAGKYAFGRRVCTRFPMC